VKRIIVASACHFTVLFGSVGYHTCAEEPTSAKLQRPDWHLRTPVTRENVQSRSSYAVLSPDGCVLAVRLYASDAGERIVLFDRRTGREIRRLATREKVSRSSGDFSMWFTPDSKQLLTWSFSEIRLWSIATGEVLFKYGEHGNGRKSSADAPIFHPTGNYFASYVLPDQRNYYLYFWDTSTLELVAAFQPRSVYPWFGCDYLRFSPDGTQLITGRWDDTFDVWSGFSEDGSLRQQATAPKLLFKKVKGRFRCFSANGRYLAVRRGDHAVLLDRTTMGEIRQFYQPTRYPRESPIQFSVDSRRLWTMCHSGVLREREVETGEMLRATKLFRTNSVRICPNEEQFYFIDIESGVVFADLKKQECFARLFALVTPGDSVVETAGGYFDFTGNWTYYRGMPDEQFRQPVFVQRILAGMSPDEAVHLPTDYRRPEISVELTDRTQDAAILSFVAQAFGKHGSIARIAVTVNGRQLASTSAKGIEPISVDRTNSHSPKWTTTIPFPPGENAVTIRAIAHDSFEQTSEPATLVVERPVKVAPISGRLFILTVGVSDYRKPEYGLRFCDADAESLADILTRQKGLAFGDVQRMVITNKQATVTNVEEGLAWIQRSCTSADVAVVLFSGHGIRGNRGLYYMTHEADANGIQYTCLNWETVGTAMLNTQAKQILFLSDVCHAGAFAQSKLLPQQEIVDQLLESAGIMVYASSQGDEKSYEEPGWGHGAFSKAILEALAGKADADSDGKITIAELQAYATPRVVELTGDRQHPHLPRLNDFAPNLVIAHVR
jgi:hypothetical protein